MHCALLRTASRSTTAKKSMKLGKEVDSSSVSEKREGSGRDERDRRRGERRRGKAVDPPESVPWGDGSRNNPFQRKEQRMQP